jgi:hypothetical protein
MFHAAPLQTSRCMVSHSCALAMHAVGVLIFFSCMAGTMSDCGHGSVYILMAQGAAFSAHPETPEQARRLSHSDSDVFVAHKAHADVSNTTLA